MKRIWNMINNMNVNRNIKNIIYIALMVCLSATFGALLWLMAGRFVYLGCEWLICFMGYPAVFFGFFGGILYIYNHDFK